MGKVPKTKGRPEHLRNMMPGHPKGSATPTIVGESYCLEGDDYTLKLDLSYARMEISVRLTEQAAIMLRESRRKELAGLSWEGKEEVLRDEMHRLLVDRIARSGILHRLGLKPA